MHTESVATRGPLDPLLTPTEAADFVKLTPRFLAVRRSTGDGPKFVKISPTCVRYLQSDLLAWVEARRRSSTSDPGPSAGDPA